MVVGLWDCGYLSIYALLILGPFIFGMPSILSHVLGPSMDLGVRLGGIKTLYHTHRFGSGHIPPSTLFVEDFYSFSSVFTPVVILMGVVVDV